MCSRGRTLAASLVRQGRDGRRPTTVDLIPAVRGRSRETGRTDRPSGRTNRLPARGSFLPEEEPHERDRMKHAGRPRRGVSRQGREKRRRRNEARLEARDEEPGPIGTCTPPRLFGAGEGAVFRSPVSTAPGFGPALLAREPADDRWRVTHGPASRGGSTVERSGCSLRGVSTPYCRRSCHGTDTVGRRRSPGDRARVIFGWTGRRFASTQEPGLRSRFARGHPVNQC